MKNNTLNKKVKINKQLASFIIFFSVLIFSYLLISFCRYINFEYNAFNSVKKDVEQYAIKHTNELRIDIFDKLFNESKNCILLDNLELRNGCYKEISYTLALIIKEEEFSYWPNDLFLVKQIDNKFFKLGWDGELRDISNTTNKKLVNRQEVNFSDFLSRKCNYFGTSNSIATSCEIYTKLELNNNESGYIVRSVGFTDDDDFVFYLFIPYFILLGMFTSLSLPRQFEYFVELLIGVIPFVIGFIAVKLFNKNKRK